MAFTSGAHWHQHGNRLTILFEKTCWLRFFHFFHKTNKVGKVTDINGGQVSTHSKRIIASRGETPYPSLQKSPPTPVCGFTPLRRNDIPTTPTLPTTFGLSFRASSLPHTYGVVFLPLPARSCLTPSPLPPLLGLALQPLPAEQSAEKRTTPLLFIFIFISVLLRF